MPLLALPIAEVALLAAHPLEDHLCRRYESGRREDQAGRAPAWWRSPAPTARPRPRTTSAHLVGRPLAVLASPASFNNVLGLARAVNDRLTPGTEVFVAEMGTYGPGEIARLCRLFPPRGRGDHHDRRGAPGADEGPRDASSRQVRDPRAGQHGRAERRRARAGRPRPIGRRDGKRVIRTCDAPSGATPTSSVRRDRGRAGCVVVSGARGTASRCRPRSVHPATWPSRSGGARGRRDRSGRSSTGSPRVPATAAPRRDRRPSTPGSSSSTTPTTPTRRAPRRRC